MSDLYIIFDGPPGPTSGHFVEVENEAGGSVGMNGRTWHQHPTAPGLWRLGPFAEWAAGKDPGLGSGEIEEYPEILPADEPHPMGKIGQELIPWDELPARVGIANAYALGWRPRNINLYGAEKTRRRRALERLFGRLLRAVRR